MFAASKTSAAAAGAPAATDPQFNYVTLLLNDTGTNGQQNNTFLDSSTNNFTITRNGTPTQGSFSPYGDLWSNYFSNAPYLSAPYTAPTQFGSGDFTVEAWMYLTTISKSNYLFAQQNASVNSNADLSVFGAGINNGGFYFGWCSGGSQYNATAPTGSMQANTWHHVACVRSGNAFTVYIDGVAKATTTSAVTVNTLASTPRNGIGGYTSPFGNEFCSGYISNLRMVKGTALYTSNFTPSTTPLTAVSGTSLLTCQSNRFKDNSSNNFAITVTGTPSVQRFSPFDPAAEYSTSVIGGSGYIPGTTNYLSTSGSAIAVGAGAFTLEGWVYFNNVNDGGFGSLCSSVINLSTDRGVSLFLTGSGAWRFRIGRSVSGQFEDFLGTTTLIRYQWYHFKIVRTSTGTNDTRLYLNGVQQAIGTSTININFAQFVVGRVYPSEFTTALDGYIAGVRLTNTAESSAVPTAPVTAVTGTALLLNFTNAGIFDNAMMNDLVTVGNAQVSTAVAKFGSSSMYFDGSGDGLFFPSTLSELSTGNFTVECWYYTGSATNQTLFAIQSNAIAYSAVRLDHEGATSKLYMLISSNGSLWAVNVGSTNTVSPNTWTHVAVVRSGSTFTLYINGLSSGTGSTSSSLMNSTLSYVGGHNSGGSIVQNVNGYIDDLRITKGFARYTANFTPPTAAFPNL